ncbi:MAG: ATP-dependent DNA helicase RecG [Schleiferiaceae bacterium]|nr:ATP-dependent DNA helicase RecG [Schleiferiaceae bacterium]
MQKLTLDTPIEYLKGIGPRKADLLKKELQLFTCRDLLFYFPFRYVDRTRFYKINQIESEDLEVQLVGKLQSLQEVQGKGRKRLVGQFADDTGTVELVWFQGARWIKNALTIGGVYVLFGKPSKYGRQWNFAHPELELLTEFKQHGSPGFMPVYRSSEKLNAQGLNSRGISKVMQQLLPAVIDQVGETLADDLRNAVKAIPIRDALTGIHFPKDTKAMQLASYRLKFEECFFLQLLLHVQKRVHHSKVAGFPFEKVDAIFLDFYNNHLPFQLTNAQKRVLKEVRRDLGSGRHMNRLIQGDVGSGKTIVALLSMLIAIDNGFQACLMAPTEILAQQHFNGLAELLEGSAVTIALLTGSTKAAERRRLAAARMDGSLHITVGTHALLEDPVQFKNLGLAIIDEQHRFGVRQRAQLWKKNTLPPHIMVMTATPIPRTLAMTVYGDLDISVIDELPPGRKPIKTLHFYESGRLRMLDLVRKEIDAGRQAYIVYPLINESETLDYKDLMEGYDAITRSFPLPKYQVSIVHGQLKPEVKEFEMQRFVSGQTQIMVATTVIEVGVNVPNASVMVIESAERFGLSQLHQLRGRVGRGADASYCILMTGVKVSKEGKRRMETMVATQDGFKIAEVDMELRGPGDIMGTKQSGVLDLKIVDVVKDSGILAAAREWAFRVLEEDPKLDKPENAGTKAEFLKLYRDKSQWGRIS